MGIVPYESERTLMVMRANGEMLSDGDTIAPSEKLTVKVSDTAGQVQLRAEGHGAWGAAACTDGGDGGVSCINNEWETTLCTFAGDADAAVTIWAGHAEGSGAPGVAVTKKFTLKVGTDSAQAPADVEVTTDGETQTTVAAADRDSTVAAADRETTDAEASSVRSQPEARTPIARLLVAESLARRSRRICTYSFVSCGGGVTSPRSATRPSSRVRAPLLPVGRENA